MAMATLECPDCHGTVSSRASTCPHCGAPAATIAQGQHRVIPTQATEFTDPVLGHRVDITHASWWTLLFGPIYFIHRGAYRHAAVGALLTLSTMGVAWLIYPFFAQQIVRTHLLREGWRASGTHITDRSADKWIWLLIALALCVGGALVVTADAVGAPAQFCPKAQDLRHAAMLAGY
jgi:hypothetical protein